MITIDEKFFILVATVLFVALVWNPVKRLLSKGLDARSERIKNELDEAIRLKEEAQSILALYQRKQKKTLEEAEGILAHAQEEADFIRKNAEAKLEEELERRTDLALQKISRMQQNVVQEIHDSAVEITLNAARSLIAENLNRELGEDIIDNAMDEIQRKLH